MFVDVAALAGATKDAVTSAKMLKNKNRFTAPPSVLP
jgi:hypothetical protein